MATPTRPRYDQIQYDSAPEFTASKEHALMEYIVLAVALLTLAIALKIQYGRAPHSAVGDDDV